MVHDEKYLIEYFGRQSSFYLEVYKDFHSGRRFSFNIGSFFFGIFWWLYRKLFLHTLIILLVIFLTEIIEGLIFQAYYLNEDIQAGIYFIQVFVDGIILGFIGNYFYIKKADKEINRILSATTDEEDRIKMLKRKGGVSWVPFAILGLIIICYFLLKDVTF